MAVKWMLYGLVLGMSLAVRAESPEAVFPCPETDSDHVPIHRSVPAWPHVAGMMCLEGTVVLEFTVGVNGRVRDALVLESDQPGIFDRAAIDATQQWFYRPRCEGGVAVEAQQRTALDFFFTEEERTRCLPGAALLTGDALELASSLGFLYSLLAEWYLSPNLAKWPEQIEAALVPRFDGDLGRVERFHHEFVASLLDAHRDRRNDSATVNAERFQALKDELERAQVPLSDLARMMLQEFYRQDARFQEQKAQMTALAAQFIALEAEVDLDPDLLDVLVDPFIGDLRLAAEQGLPPDDRRLFADLVLMLETSVGDWTAQEEGIRFIDSEDQQRFVDLLRGATQAYWRIRENRDQFMLGFMDYRQ